MAGVFETWISQLRIGFISGPVGRSIWGAWAKVLGDNSIADMQTMTQQRLPSFACPEANGLTANDRQLEKGPTETDASFAARLVAAPVQWKLAGTPLGMLIQLYYAGFTTAVIVTQNGLAHNLSGSPVFADLVDLTTQPHWYVITTLNNANPAIPASTDGKPAIAANTIPWWNFPTGPMDAAGNQWNGRFGILFTASPIPDLTVAATLARIKRIIGAWKPQSRLCAGIWVLNSGLMWGWPVTQHWGDPGLVWGGSTSFFAVD